MNFSTSTMSRRNLIEGSAIFAGATVAGTAVSTVAHASTGEASADAPIPRCFYSRIKPDIWDMEADVVVVGGGAGGMMAAKTAAEAGASVILLDKNGILGGDMNYNEGGLHAAGTSVQEEAGMQDSAEAWAEKWWSLEGGVPNKELLFTIALTAPKLVDYFRNRGVEFRLGSNESPFAPEGIARVHHTSSRNGHEFTVALEENLEELGVTILTDARVTNILRAADGHVFGVIALKDGRELAVGGKAIVCSTGHAWRNDELIARYNPETSQFGHQSGWYATGDGYNMFLDIDAGFTNFKQLGREASFHNDEDGQAMQVDVFGDIDFSGPKAFIYLNPNLQRELPEFSGFLNYPADASSVQTMVFDQTFFDDEEFTYSTGGATHAMVQGALDSGKLIKADSLPELAEALGWDPDALQTAVDEYNNGVAAGNEDTTGREPETAAPLATAPYYAKTLRVIGKRLAMTPHVNERLEVSDVNGNIIPGLFAAGVWWLQRVLYGDVYPGGGTYMASALTSGIVAGTSAAEYAASVA